MQEDLKGLQDDTLDHIARRMDDIRRRLDLGRAGPKVRKEEDGVIKSLDKMIKKLEDNSNNSKPAAVAATSPCNPPTRAASWAGKGPGDVTKKDIGSGSGWGNLPPKERERGDAADRPRFPLALSRRDRTIFPPPGRRRQ